VTIYPKNLSIQSKRVNAIGS